MWLSEAVRIAAEEGGEQSRQGLSSLRLGYFFSSAGQFVSKVIDEDLVRSAVSTAKCWPSGLTSYMGSEEAAFGKSN